MTEKRKFRFLWAMLLVSAAIGLGSTVVESITGSGVSNYLTYWVDNVTQNSTNLTVVGISTWYFDTPPRNNTTSSVNLYVSPATVFLDGYMTSTAFTALQGKAVADGCTGGNSTHQNVTQNYTTAGAQCVMVARDTSSSRVLSTFISEVNNSGTIETSLYNYSIPAGTLSSNGDFINFEFSGYTAGCTLTVTCDLSFYINTTKVYDSSAVILSVDQSWTVFGTIQRISSTTARVNTRLGSTGAMTWVYNNETKTDININWNNAVNINLTGTSNGASNQIIARQGWVKKG